MKRIPLTKGQFALVDDEDFEYLSQWKWTASFSSKSCYAKRNIPLSNPKRQFKCSMHRIIMNAPPDLQIDHIDGNGLNNQKHNLRICSHAENMRNQRKQENTASLYKGVRVDKRVRTFAAVISRDKTTYYLGSFKNQIDAAKAYDKKAKELFGEFACLNFPEKN